MRSLSNPWNVLYLLWPTEFMKTQSLLKASSLCVTSSAHWNHLMWTTLPEHVKNKSETQFKMGVRYFYVLTWIKMRRIHVWKSHMPSHYFFCSVFPCASYHFLCAGVQDFFSQPYSCVLWLWIFVVSGNGFSEPSASQSAVCMACFYGPWIFKNVSAKAVSQGPCSPLDPFFMTEALICLYGAER